MRKYIIAGLLVWLPLGVTILVIKLLVDLTDQTLLLLPPAWRPEAIVGFHIPGIGVVIAAVVVFSTGIVVANLLGRRLVAAWEGLLSRIPLVRSIYIGVKQVAETVLSTSNRSFRQVVLVEYPRRGLWSLGFVTNSQLPQLHEKTGREVLAVFVPTTPNPTSGFVLMVPRDELIDMEMEVDEGLKMIISMGVVAPNSVRGDAAPVAGAPGSP